MKENQAEVAVALPHPLADGWARRLLRETKWSVVAIALDVGCANPSDCAQLFRQEIDR
jgi:hypothetical protein